MPSRTFIPREEKSMLGTKASNDRLTVLIRIDGDFKLKPMLNHYSQNPKALKNYANSILPVFYKWKNKSMMIAHLFKP